MAGVVLASRLPAGVVQNTGLFHFNKFVNPSETTISYTFAQMVSLLEWLVSIGIHFSFLYVVRRPANLLQLHDIRS